MRREAEMERRGLRGKLIVSAGVIVLFFLPVLFKSSDYVFHTLNMIAYYTIAVTGLNILLGYTGQISIGHAALFAIGAYTSALLALKFGFSAFLLIPLSGLAAAVVGFFMGAACLRLKEIYLAMGTIGLGGAVEGVIINWDTLTGGSMGLLGIPYLRVGSFVFNTQYRQYFLVYPIMIFLLLIARGIISSRFGRAMMAIREDAIAAASYGIDTTGYKLLAFTLSAFYGGIAGSLFAHSTGILFPDHFSMEVSILLLMMVVIGGRGTISGSIMGATLMTAGFEFLRGLKEFQMVIYGILLVFFILFMPQGIMGSLLMRKDRILLWLGWERK
jgi:branched-chain amino acid transport system permease protein